MKNRLPRLDWLDVKRGDRTIAVPYLYREGTGGPSILFVHGLAGSKENFYAAFQSPALADCKLIAFDEPGTGLAPYDPEAAPDVSALADLAQSVADELVPEPFFLAGASMGGLITLLQLRRHGTERIRGLINLEGNLAPEDCMFSRRTVIHTLDTLAAEYQQVMRELRASRYAGDQIIGYHMELNVDVRAYHAYSFETVAESDSGNLLKELLALPIPRLFLYGEANRGLTYLPQLRASDVEVKEIPASAHFLFYDNPIATFAAIGAFVHEQTRASPAS